MRAKKAEISGSLLLEKALSNEMRIDSATARLRGSKRRINYVPEVCQATKLHREADTASANHWVEEVILAEYEPQNVFNFDQTELVYRAPLDGNFV